MLTPKSRTLGLLAIASLLAMSLWFSATAVTPALMNAWDLSPGTAAWLTMTVQIGFVVGAVLSALFNVADLWPPRRVFAVGAWVGAALNALVIWAPGGVAGVMGLRFGTGMALAAVYPVGMKIMASWTREDRGFGIGLLVGALTVGSASPHLVRAFGRVEQWQPVLLTVSMLAVLGGAIVWVAGSLGPYAGPAPKFRWSYLGRALSDRALRLANFGYLGHMWELYAMWTWIALFLTFAYGQARPDSQFLQGDTARIAAAVTFVVIAAGGVGSVLAGRLADRWGRTRTTIASMVISGTCAVVIGPAMAVGPAVVTAVALVWGFTIVADSAQFSAAVSELGEPEYMGTLLTTQTSMGFLLTLVSIRLVPALVDRVGWEWAFVPLAIGPALGSVAMRSLRRTPDAVRLAGGRA